MTFTRGDNLQAFDGLPIEIDIDATEQEKAQIKKAIFVINKEIAITFINPPFPLQVELDETKTRQLKDTNIGELIVFDSQNRKLTCEGRLIFSSKGEVYNESNV